MLQTPNLKACYQRQPFRPTRANRGRPCNRQCRFRAAPTDNVDDVDLRSALPREQTSAGQDADGHSAEDTVLKKRLQALHLQHQTDHQDSGVTSTSGRADDQRDLLARTSHQLQRLNPSRLSPRVRGLILLNILVLLCGATWVVLKETGDFFDPFTFAALRFSIAAAVFFPWVKNAVKDRKVLRGGLELGIYSALAYMTQSVGLITSDASRASFISTFTVNAQLCCTQLQPLLELPCCLLDMFQPP